MMTMTTMMAMMAPLSELKKGELHDGIFADTASRG